MKSRAYCFTLLLAIVISNTANLPAQAQRARVFVSVAGNDSNPCTAGSPCKTFQHAHDVVLAGGEISVLDTGGYGILTITKAVSIVAVGVQASIATTSGNTGIIINAGSTDNVSLRGLTLDGAGGGENGILFNTGLSLTVEDCVVRNMTQFGLFLAPTVASSLGVSNSHFDDNGSVGILIQTESANAVTVAIDRTTFYDNAGAGLAANGEFGTGALNVAVTDSSAAHGNFGFVVASAAGQSVTSLSLTHTLAEGNSNAGVRALGTNSTLWLAQSTVTGNTASFDVESGGVINSYGDNYFSANGVPTGSLSTATKQ